MASPNYRIGKHLTNPDALMACKHICNQYTYSHAHFLPAKRPLIGWRVLDYKLLSF